MGKKRQALLAASHFLVDFACALFLLRHGGGRAALLWYNFCAFALQMPLGLLTDERGGEAHFAALGCALTALSPLTGPWMPVAAGVGNALFHIGGGTEVLYRTRGASALGCFVAPGAVGLFCGAALTGTAFPAPAVSVALLGLALALLFASTPRPAAEPSAPVSPGTVWMGMALFAVVILRSWVGLGTALPWKAGALAFLAALAAAGGKSLGGIYGDLFSPGRTAAVSLTLAAGLFFLTENPWAGLSALLAFNMTMPLTLLALAERLPRHRGFAFGLLTFALFLGFLPVYFGAPPLMPAAAAALSAVSAALLWPAVKGGRP